MNSTDLTYGNTTTVEWYSKNMKMHYGMGIIWIAYGIGKVTFTDPVNREGVFSYVAILFGLAYLFVATFYWVFGSSKPHKIVVSNQSAQCIFGLKKKLDILFEDFQMITFGSYHVIFDGKDNQYELYLHDGDPVKSKQVKAAIRFAAESKGIVIKGG